MAENWEIFSDMAFSAGFRITERFSDWLTDAGYFASPASRSRHGAYPGGLFDHHVAAFRNLMRLTESMNLK